ncbi:PKD domain-containing protein, partial [Acidobacteriota bacterium]
EASDHGDYYGIYTLISPPFDPGESTELSFRHSFETEQLFDGCTIEITTDNGITWTDLMDDITSGGYNGESLSLYFLTSYPNTEGRMWTGTNPSGPLAFDTVTVDLSSYWWTKTARLRFRFFYDHDTNGPTGHGWTIDNVRFDDVNLHWSCCGKDDCIPPGMALYSTAPVCADDPVAFSQDDLFEGCGTFAYTWDFGDASPLVEFDDPAHVFNHIYTTPGLYTALLYVEDLSTPGCNQLYELPVQIDDGSDPTGDVGNTLVMTRHGDEVTFAWGGQVTPKYYNLHETTRKGENLGDSETGIGAQPVIAAPDLVEEITLQFNTVPGELRFYEVWGKNLCTGETVFP